MKLWNILSVISGSTHIIIYDGCAEAFNGKMCEVSKTAWDKKMEKYMNCDIIRVNTIDGAITIAVSNMEENLQ